MLTLSGRALILALAQPATPSTAIAELERLEQQLAATWKAGYCAAWGEMLAPEWSVMTHGYNPRHEIKPGL